MNDLNFDSIGVLAYIIKCCAKFNYFINYTKAQKLLYCCYGVILAQFNIRLTKEHPKAWQYGPVFPRAFNAQHKNLFMPISRKSNCNFKTLCLCSCPYRSPNATKMLNTKTFIYRLL